VCGCGWEATKWWWDAVPARFYIILWTAMWAVAVGLMVMAYLGAIQEVGAPLCGAPFYQFLIPKMIVAAAASWAFWDGVHVYMMAVVWSLG
jgi:hypothetical protein